MKVRTLELSVGVLMLAGIAALLVLAVKVSGLTFAASEPTYKVYARFDNIGGLTSRSKVTIAGVPIGRVTSIQLDPKDFRAKVEMQINQSVNYLSTDSSAMILTSGLLGEKYIGIQVGADDTMLKDGDIIEYTQSALVLEDLIGKFLSSQTKK
ncbi:organic solvent ABC transporter substrate-binding protein [Pokkaliibacter plantistimulans]|uniref:Organic solvent ABC transporter substrate-binding protein n=1 Tax=Pokkaliibacter plantistimulans TaxID=1635171 RepID=A0ABX5M1W9_9GAMM|nr:outer membrane lipid asymmetry maintenance protein MlaD [Pokkaliibacter plantistimulans]PXF31733.1 organic solvent ABC transporter substrate-binding protein [Pokkaliibacter plantistimulans]